MKKTFLFLALALSTMAYAKDLKVMIFSDPHVLHQSLFTSTTDFSGGLLLSEYSQELFDAEIAMVKDSMPDVLLLPGDMSNNGDSVSHRYVSNRLKELSALGIQVCVVPGNHDIDEPGAKSYTSVPTGPIDYGQFRDLYNTFGYQQAESICGDNLSYMIYLGDSLALICLNSALSNKEGHQSAGGITESLLSWTEAMAAKAIAAHRYPYAMMHHQIVQHFDNQLMIDNDHVANCGPNLNSPSLQELQSRLVDAGITTVFTGHAHMHSAKDVVPSESVHGRTLYDISSNATSSYGASARVIYFDGGAIRRMKTVELPGTASLTAAERDAVALKRTQNMANSAFTKVSNMAAAMLGAPSLAGTLSSVFTPLLKQYMLADYTQVFANLERGDEVVDFAAADALIDACDEDYGKVKTELKNNAGLQFTLGLAGATEKFNAALNDGGETLKNTVASIMLNLTDYSSLETSPVYQEHLALYHGEKTLGDCLYINRVHDSDPTIPQQYVIPSVPTSILDAQATDAPTVEKRMVAGQVVILRDGKVYNMLGAELK